MYKVLSNEEIEKHMREMQNDFILKNSIYQTMHNANMFAEFSKDINQQQLNNISFQGMTNNFM